MAPQVAQIKNAESPEYHRSRFKIDSDWCGQGSGSATPVALATVVSNLLL
jgi:hypothetical protein